jgi:hypothetical protein
MRETRTPSSHAFVAGALALAIAALGVAAPPAPTNVVAEDNPWDDGTALRVTWTSDAPDVAGWRIRRTLGEEERRQQRERHQIEAAAQAYATALAAAQAAGQAPEDAKQAATAAAQAAATKAGGDTLEPFVFVGIAGASDRSFVVEGLDGQSSYVVSVEPRGADGDYGEAALSAEAQPAQQLFRGDRLWFGIMLFGVIAMILGCVVAARSGVKMRIRRIAGLDAIDEAVGRATEMGRPVLFIPGIQDMDNVQTVAGVTILGRVAKTAAEYDATIEVPTARSLVMTACQDVVQSAYYEAGRADAYNPDTIRYITDEQFGFAAYAAGRMVREKPATCVYMGQFYAESLLLSENGNAVGAIQIAGTGETSQLPFFVAACDYTLIGEEFFAASAYLSREPLQMGSLMGQDMGKAMVMVLVVIGVICTTAGALGLVAAQGVADFLANTVLKS